MAEPIVRNVTAYKINHFAPGGNGYLMKRRAKSSMPLSRKFQENIESNTLDEYTGPDENYRTDRIENETIAYRPMTSNGFRVPFNLSDPVGVSHYDENFYQKKVKYEEPIRTGTASGNRSNKPHPTKEFMIFRFRPLKITEDVHSDWSRPLGDKLISQVIRNQMKSVMKQDYVNNVDEKARFEEMEKNISRPSTGAQLMRWNSLKMLEQQRSIPPMPINYPFNYESLYISPSRYGSNIKHQQAAVGIIPGASRFRHDFN